DNVAPIHLAVQYLAAAGISFLVKQEDDSHTNLGYSPDLGQIYTRPLNDKGDQLLLDLNDFSLKWRSDIFTEEIELHSRTHKEVLAWISNVTDKAGLRNAFKYQFHYELPYEIKDDYIFNVPSEILERERHLRSLTHNVLAAVLETHGLESEIRIWPHHFDSGAFSHFPAKDIAVGLGLAIPDQLVDDYYYYISGYKGHQSFVPQGAGSLPIGSWKTEGFTGAILPATDRTPTDVKAFFGETISKYRN
ncbi:MAG: hypothetical protein ABF293_04610, partial [Flavobacteriaceae bacterium]